MACANKKRKQINSFSHSIYFPVKQVHNVKWSKGIFQRRCKNGSNQCEIITNIIFPCKQLPYFLKIISIFSIFSVSCVLSRSVLFDRHAGSTTYTYRVSIEKVLFYAIFPTCLCIRVIIGAVQVFEYYF